MLPLTMYDLRSHSQFLGSREVTTYLGCCQ